MAGTETSEEMSNFPIEGHESSASFPAAEEIRTDVSRSRRKGCSKSFWIFASVLVAVAVGLAVGLGVGLSRRNNQADSGYEDAAAAAEFELDFDVAQATPYGTSGAASMGAMASAVATFLIAALM